MITKLRLSSYASFATRQTALIFYRAQVSNFKYWPSFNPNLNIVLICMKRYHLHKNMKILYWRKAWLGLKMGHRLVLFQFRIAQNILIVVQPFCVSPSTGIETYVGVQNSTFFAKNNYFPPIWWSSCASLCIGKYRRVASSSFNIMICTFLSFTVIRGW